MEKEVCTIAAVMARIPGTEHYRVILGKRHHDCIWIAHQAGFTAGEEGFLTNKHRFVSRIEGRELQEAAGIKSISPDGYYDIRLFSEDLY